MNIANFRLSQSSQRLSIRLGLFGAAVLITAVLVVSFCVALDAAGVHWAFIGVLGGLFLPLTAWISVGFVSACIGFVQSIRESGEAPRRSGVRPSGSTSVAIVVPIYNEDPHRVFAGVAATRDSLQRTGFARVFDIHVLSDTTNAETWLGEEAYFRQASEQAGSDVRIFYRHRANNTRRKVGNLEEFLDRRGDDYDFMIAFDVDSVMQGETLCAMVARMEREPDLGILQAPPAPVSRESLFARVQQFATAVYGSVFTAGLAHWAGGEGNYFGHNAIIRLDAFREHCSLPDLPGDGPLGGEILSHDLVEAAFMGRAGYRVEIATDLPGSYEELPTTVIDFVKRDQRWCQGNMQHLRVLRRERLHPISVIHLLNGAMSYISAPLWALTILVGLAAAASAETGGAPPTALRLGIATFGAMMLMLLAPKALALLALIWYPDYVDRFGGPLRVTASVLLESLISVLVAPVFMVFYTSFVVSTLLGTKVGWSTQSRDERRTSLPEAVDAHGVQTIIGILLIAVASQIGTWLLWWTAPIWLGLVLSVPLSMVLSSTALGAFAARRRLLATSEDIAAPAVLRDLKRRLEAPPLSPGTSSGLWLDALRVDNDLNRLHVSLLPRSGDTCRSAGDAVAVRLASIVRLDGAVLLPNEDRKRLLNDAGAVRSLLDAPSVTLHPEPDPARVTASGLDHEGGTGLKETSVLLRKS